MSTGIVKYCRSRDLMCKCLRNIACFSSGQHPTEDCKAAKMEKLARKLREKTPIGRLDEPEDGKHPFQEKDPLPPFPGGVNPETGEVGGPRGPEPTRYGDWERKGRVTDF